MGMIHINKQMNCVQTAGSIVAQRILDRASKFNSQRLPRAAVSRAAGVVSLGEYTGLPRSLSDPLTTRKAMAPYTPTPSEMLRAQITVRHLMVEMVFGEKGFRELAAGQCDVEIDGVVLTLTIALNPGKPDFRVTLYPDLRQADVQAEYGGGARPHPLHRPVMPDAADPTALAPHCTWMFQELDVVNPDLYSTPAERDALQRRTTIVVFTELRNESGLVGLVDVMCRQAALGSLRGTHAAMPRAAHASALLDTEAAELTVQVWPGPPHTHLREASGCGRPTLTLYYSEARRTIDVRSTPCVGLTRALIVDPATGRPSLPRAVSVFTERLQLLVLTSVRKSYPSWTISRQSTGTFQQYILEGDQSQVRVCHKSGALVRSGPRFAAPHPDALELCGLTSTRSLVGVDPGGAAGVYIALAAQDPAQPVVWIDYTQPTPTALAYWSLVAAPLDVDPPAPYPTRSGLSDLHNLRRIITTLTRSPAVDDALRRRFATPTAIPAASHPTIGGDPPVISAVWGDSGLTASVTVGKAKRVETFPSFREVHIAHMIVALSREAMFGRLHQTFDAFARSVQQHTTYSLSRRAEGFTGSVAFTMLDSPVHSVDISLEPPEVTLNINPVEARPVIDEYLKAMLATATPDTVQGSVQRVLAALPLLNVVNTILQPARPHRPPAGTPVHVAAVYPMAICPCDWTLTPAPVILPPVSSKAAVVSAELSMHQLGLVIGVEQGKDGYLTLTDGAAAPGSPHRPLLVQLYSAAQAVQRQAPTAAPTVTPAVQAQFDTIGKLMADVEVESLAPRPAVPCLPYLPLILIKLYGADAVIHPAELSVRVPLWKTVRGKATSVRPARLALLPGLLRNHIMTVDVLQQTIPAVFRENRQYKYMGVRASAPHRFMYIAATMATGVGKLSRLVNLFVRSDFDIVPAADGTDTITTGDKAEKAYDLPLGIQLNIGSVNEQYAVVNDPNLSAPQKLLTDLFRHSVFTAQPERLASLVALTSIKDLPVLQAVLETLFSPTPTRAQLTEGGVSRSASALLSLRTVMHNTAPRCDATGRLPHAPAYVWDRYIAVRWHPYDHLPAGLHSGYKVDLLVKGLLDLAGQPQAQTPPSPVDVLNEPDGAYIPTEIAVGRDTAGQTQCEVRLARVGGAAMQAFIQFGEVHVMKQDKYDLATMYGFLNSIVANPSGHVERVIPPPAVMEVLARIGTHAAPQTPQAAMGVAGQTQGPAITDRIRYTVAAMHHELVRWARTEATRGEKRQTMARIQLVDVKRPKKIAYSREGKR